ncbi:MAG: hypothetical protein ACTSYD_03820 [Candidatus Heimdallarchaeaceae archaeon]
MPQIICPNCGMTINLEKRRETDFYLIKKATRTKPRTFTELLHITKLSRRTLSVRLKELCAKGILVKREDGKYQLNGNHNFNDKNPLEQLPYILKDGNRKVRISLMLIGLLLTSVTFGYVLAMFIPKESEPQPTILGTFTMVLQINNIKDLYAWQVIIKYNPQNLKLIDASPGGFLGKTPPQYLNETNVNGGIFLGPKIEKNTIMVGGTLIGNVEGKNGSGKLAIITFGYYTTNYETPEIIIKQGRFQTILLDSTGTIIPIDENTLTLTPVK